jgi:hypothetical protein
MLIDLFNDEVWTTNFLLTNRPVGQVDLGIEAKIMNIERTEKAKRKLLEEAKRTGAGAADRDAANPSNMYVQHDRYEQTFSLNVCRVI